jgi:hypothetical protein
VVTPCAICDGEQGLCGAAVDEDALGVVKDVEDDGPLLGELVALVVAGAEWAVGVILTGGRRGVSLEKH